MAKYDELYNMIVEESMKGSIGRAGLKTIDGTKKIVDKVSDKVDNISNKVSSGYEKAKETKVAGPVIKGVEKATTIPFDVSSDIIANGIQKGKEVYYKNKYKDDPETLEIKIKSSVKELDNLKSDIMAIEIWTVGWPLAIKSAGILDNIFKSIILAGAVAKEDKELVSAVAKAMMWVPAAALMVKKILGKKEDDGEKGDVDYIKKITDKVISKLKSWAIRSTSLYL